MNDFYLNNDLFSPQHYCYSDVLMLLLLSVNIFYELLLVVIIYLLTTKYPNDPTANISTHPIVISVGKFIIVWIPSVSNNDIVVDINIGWIFITISNSTWRNIVRDNFTNKGIFIEWLWDEDYDKCCDIACV